MNPKSKNLPRGSHSKVVTGILKRAGMMGIFLILITAILFVASGQIDWIWPWVYLGISLLSIFIIGAISLTTNPEMIAERGEFKLTRRWDQVVSGMYMSMVYILLPLVAGLDQRFSWTPDLTLGWHITGAVVLGIGLGLTGWAMIENSFFSTAVRIQDERGHRVCDSGPYRFVRHPGYVGYILQALGMAILLGSLFALIPAIIGAIALIWRTALEDHLLQNELPGYQEYSQRIRYRLVPGIW